MNFKLTYVNKEGKEASVEGNAFVIIEYLLNKLKNSK